MRFDCSISLGSTWRVSVVVRIHYAYRKEDIKGFSMRPTASDFIHNKSVCVCVCACVCLCVRTASMALHGIYRDVFRKVGSAEGCQGFRGTKMLNPYRTNVENRVSS